MQKKKKKNVSNLWWLKIQIKEPQTWCLYFNFE